MDNVRNRVRWCADHLDSLRTRKIKIIFMAEGEIYETRTGYVNMEVLPFPEAPEVPGKRFVEWNYDDVDDEGNLCAWSFNEYIPVPETALEESDGDMTFTVYASFEERDEEREVKDIQFQQSSYRLCLKTGSVDNWINIPVRVEPSNGYTDEIDWSLSDDSIAEFISAGNLISVRPMKAGTMVISGTLMDGTTRDLPITVIALEADDDPMNYRVTDFRLSADAMTLRVGEEAVIGIEVLSPENYLNLPDGNGLEYEWYVESGNACSAGVGTITAETVGTAVIACRNTASDVIQTCTITVVY